MLPKTERLSRAQFSEILENKGFLTIYNRLGTLKYIPSGTKQALSVVTSSKYEKKAVIRNKLRRRLYSLFGKEKSEIMGIFYTAKGSYTLSYLEIQTLFNELLKKTAK